MNIDLKLKIIITLYPGKLFHICVLNCLLIIDLFRIISEKDGLPPNFANLPTAQTSFNKNLPHTQVLPIPIDTALKNNPTMNLMDFTFNPYSKVNILKVIFGKMLFI